jgi:hypothetical protein
MQDIRQSKTPFGHFFPASIVLAIFRLNYVSPATIILTILFHLRLYYNSGYSNTCSIIDDDHHGSLADTSAQTTTKDPSPVSS